MNRSTTAGLPQSATLAKFQSRLAESGQSGFAGKVNQLGINMVDLMMWLVIAALLLAAALQGIGFYQKAAWNYQLNSDASAVRTYMEAQYTLNNNTYPDQAKVTAASGAGGDLKLTSSNGSPNSVTNVVNTAAGGWTATVCSGALKKAGVANSGINISSADATVTTPATCAVVIP
jgi:Tfp pilus assembly protein PilE